MKNLIAKLQEKQSEIMSTMADVYNEGKQPYNTDIIIWKDGRITTYNYFGSCFHTADDIVEVMTISNQMKQSSYDGLNMSEEEIQLCIEKGWLACMEGDIESEFEWSASDMIDEFEQWIEILENS